MTTNSAEKLAAIKHIVHQEGIFDVEEVEGVSQLATKLSNTRQHMLWSIEELARLRKRVYMLETGLDAAVQELRILRAGRETVQHYTRVLKDDMALVVQEEKDERP